MASELLSSCTSSELRPLSRADLEIALYFGTATRFRAEDLPGQNTATWLRNMYKKDQKQDYQRNENFTQHLAPSLQSNFLDLMSLSAFVGRVTASETKLELYTFHDIILFFGYGLVQSRPLHQPGLTKGFESLLHLGLLAFLITFLGGLGHHANYKSVTDSLRWTIQAAHDQRDEFQKLVLWALLLGGHVLFTEADEYWLLPRLVEVTSMLKLRKWDDVEQIIVQFPWIQSIHGKTAISLWKKSRENYKGFIESGVSLPTKDCPGEIILSVRESIWSDLDMGRSK